MKQPKNTTTPSKQDSRGLAGQTIGETEVCAVNQTQLIYRGYEIADLAANATFEEVAFLLIVGHKPSESELKAFADELTSFRAVSDNIRDSIIQIANRSFRKVHIVENFHVAIMDTATFRRSAVGRIVSGAILAIARTAK